ncbi:hypothetical protein CIU55_03430 [Salmonella enterica]|nr:hypothetical protein [Salmonella enterica]EDX4410278.1 hypothetical protein [Salmonella enterica subsp. houtenae serovar 44:z36,[z38]:-]EEB1681175.1 hypothetical protein [Salmonella enterica]QWN73895.1 hypothetical protein CIU55_03430 [Salmonella enterica]
MNNIAMTRAERQARYCRSTRKRRENDASRMNTEILCGAKLALKRLSLHHGVSQRAVPELIIMQTDITLHQYMNEQECDSYPELTPVSLRSNRNLPCASSPGF